MSLDLINKILKLKQERNAIILAHYYQPDEIQNLADYVGDSYYLSKIAKNCDEEIIVFCGVKFMGESAKILSPSKKVLVPSKDAGCLMADMVNENGLIKLKNKYKDAAVICYINSTYRIKALSDITVTSSSAVKIIKNIPNKQVIFLPDKNLGQYISEFFKEKEFILWDGFCPHHNEISKENVVELKTKYKNSKILVHPECTKEIRTLADFIGSTSEIIDYATKENCNEFIICTEEGILYELKNKNPNKSFYIPGRHICCQDMKKTTLENLYDTLLNMKNEIILNEDIRKKALSSLENMHKLGE